MTIIATKCNPKKAAFLAAYRECATIRGAAEAANVSASSHYNWLRDDPVYVGDFNQASLIAADVIEEAARQRAIHGVRSFKFDKNGNPLIHPETKEPYYELRYSDTLLIFLLKGLVPERYSDRQVLTHAVVDWRDELRQQGIDPDRAVVEMQTALDRARLE